MLVRYIGSAPTETDTLYRTGAHWNEPGEVVDVQPDEKARLMVANHPDVYEAAEDPEAAAAAPQVQAATAAGDMGLSIHTIVSREPDGSTRLLRDATLPVLKAYATDKLGMGLAENATRKQILEIIEEALADDATAGAEEQPAPEETAAAGEGLDGLAAAAAAAARDDADQATE